MSRRKTFNYSGRTVDLFIMDLPEDTFAGEAQLKISTPVRICTGAQKLVQIFLIQFLTGIGTKTLDPTWGTAIGDEVIGLIVPDEDTMRHLINISNVETRDQILEQQNDLVDADVEIPDDEFLVESSIEEVLIVNVDDVRVKIYLETQAGAGVEFVVPINFSIT